MRGIKRPLYSVKVRRTTNTFKQFITNEPHFYK